MLLLVTFDLASADIAAFDAYEAAVLPLLTRHGGELKFRVRSQDDAFEMHLVKFPDEAAFESYRLDSDRQRMQPQLQRSGAVPVITPVVGF